MGRYRVRLIRDFAPLFLLVLASRMDGLRSESFADAPLLRLNGVEQERVYISQFMEELEDPDGRVSYEDVRNMSFHPVGREFIHHGMTDSVWWFRFTYRLDSPAPTKDLLLCLFNFRLLDVVSYIESDEKLIKTFHSGMNGRREVPNRDLIFRIPASGEPVTVYLRVVGVGPLRMLPSVVSAEVMQREDHILEWFIGIAIGGQIALAFYNLMLFAALRDRSYLLYSLFCLSFVLVQLNLDGYTYQLFLAGHPLLDLRLSGPIVFLSLLALNEFSRNFLGADSPKDWPVLKAVSVCMAGMIVLSWFLSIHHAMGLAGMAFFPVAILVAGSGVRRFLSGFRPARFFLLAILPLILFLFVFALGRFFPLIPTKFFHYDLLFRGLPLSGIASGLLFSFALSDRFRQLQMKLDRVRTEKERVLHHTKVLDHLAHHDSLTGLPNRLLLISRLEHAIQRTRRDGTSGAVLFIDLDGFKYVNDSMGHSAGDELLRMLSLRMRERLRDVDMLARLGGDEFVIILDSVSGPRAASIVARDILCEIARPFDFLSGSQACISASIGIALFPEDGDDPDEVIERADRALYQAKQSGRGGYVFFNSLVA